MSWSFKLQHGSWWCSLCIFANRWCLLCNICNAMSVLQTIHVNGQMVKSSKVDLEMLQSKCDFSKCNLLYLNITYIFRSIFFNTKRLFYNWQQLHIYVPENAIPQGSIMGPFTFYIFTNDICRYHSLEVTKKKDQYCRSQPERSQLLALRIVSLVVREAWLPWFPPVDDRPWLCLAPPGGQTGKLCGCELSPLPELPDRVTPYSQMIWLPAAARAHRSEKFCVATIQRNWKCDSIEKYWENSDRKCNGIHEWMLIKFIHFVFFPLILLKYLRNILHPQKLIMYHTMI